MGSRAHLLAGLRTGGPRASSPFEGDNSTHSIIDHQRHPSGSPPSNGASLKANAAPFTPGGRRASRGSPTRDSTQELEGQFAALRMQHAMAAAEANHAQPHLAAMYGATSGQPLANEAQYGQTYDYQTQLQAQEMEQLIRQKQAQLVQNQLLQQQQQQQQQQNRQSQIDALRAQAANHQKQQQMFAQQQQQQLLLAQMQADMEAQQQQVYTAQEQRQAAQASIQAGLRQRQVQQMYAQLLQQQQQQQQQDEAVSQQEALLQRLHYLRQLQQGAASSPPQQQQFVDFGYNSSPPQTGGRAPARSGSPAQAQLERRQRQASNTAADSAVSWRSTSVSLTKSASAQARSPPSIVVDDGASEKSDPGPASSTTSEPLDTPETSSEDVGTMMRSKSAVPTRTVKKMPVLAPVAVPRAISLSTAPRARTFSSSVDGATKSGNNSGTGSPSGAMAGASRQPRGPPTEFHAVNFTSRINARTRRDAMSKLCASPRAASFNLTATRASVLT